MIVLSTLNIAYNLIAQLSCQRDIKPDHHREAIITSLRSQRHNHMEKKKKNKNKTYRNKNKTKRRSVNGTIAHNTSLNNHNLATKTKNYLQKIYLPFQKKPILRVQKKPARKTDVTILTDITVLAIIINSDLYQRFSTWWTWN